MENKKVVLSSPWANFFKEVQVLFDEDPEIKVIYDDNTPEIKLLVDSIDKADALSKLLPVEKSFGNVTLKITIVPANDNNESRIRLLEKAFKNNPVFSFAQTAEGIFTNPVHYFVFRNQVVQYYNDDLGDINGNRSTLYQEIAKEVFGEDEGVHFCTDLPDEPWTIED